MRKNLCITYSIGNRYIVSHFSYIPISYCPHYVTYFMDITYISVTDIYLNIGYFNRKYHILKYTLYSDIFSMETRLRQKIRMELLSQGKDISKHDEKAIIVNDFNVGRPDIENSLEVIEIKSIRKYKHAIGQVLVYAKLKGKKPKIILLEDVQMNKKDIETIRGICESFSIKVEILGYDYLRKYTEDILHDWRFKMKKKHLVEIVSKTMKPNEYAKMKKEELCIQLPFSSWRGMNSVQLKHLAKQYSISGATSMKKETLISTIESHIHKHRDTDTTSSSKGVVSHPFLKAISTPERKLSKNRPPISREEEDIPNDLSSLTVPELRKRMKEMNIDLPSRPYIRKDDLLRIVSNPSLLDSILEESK